MNKNILEIKEAIDNIERDMKQLLPFAKGVEYVLQDKHLRRGNMGALTTPMWIIMEHVQKVKEAIDAELKATSPLTMSVKFEHSATDQ